MQFLIIGSHVAFLLLEAIVARSVTVNYFSQLTISSFSMRVTVRHFCLFLKIAHTIEILKDEVSLLCV